MKEEFIQKRIHFDIDLIIYDETTRILKLNDDQLSISGKNQKKKYLF